MLLSMAPRSRLEFCQASSLQVVNRPLCAHDWSCCSMGQALTKLNTAEELDPGGKGDYKRNDHQDQRR